MDNKTKIADSTSGTDLSGLKLDKNKTYSTSELYFAEAQNIVKASIKYLADTPRKN